MNVPIHSIRVAVVGSRTFKNNKILTTCLDVLIPRIQTAHPDKPLILLSGGAEGADTLAFEYARNKGIQTYVLPAPWHIFGREGADGAGLLRNTMLASIATHCIAFHKGNSSGTAHMIKACKDRNVQVKIFYF